MARGKKDVTLKVKVKRVKGQLFSYGR